MTIRDKDGLSFDGASTYRLTVPPKPPVRLYWSATAYDRATHALIRDQKWSSGASTPPGLQTNADGSVDVYFGPKAPEGEESNWVPTSTSGKFEVLFRLYGPEKPLFDKSWMLPDIERMPTVHHRSRTIAIIGEKRCPGHPDNFVRAESDLYFGNAVKDAGGVGKFSHHREPTPIEKQPVIRMNRDTLYSAAVFDLDAGPVTVTLPDAGNRFMSMQVIDENQYMRPAIYRPGSYTFTRKEIGARYVVIAIRTLVDPADPNEIEQVHAIKVDQPDGPGKFEVPNWDPVSQKKVRDALLVLLNRPPLGGFADPSPRYSMLGYLRSIAFAQRQRLASLCVLRETGSGLVTDQLSVIARTRIGKCPSVLKSGESS